MHQRHISYVHLNLNLIPDSTLQWREDSVGLERAEIKDVSFFVRKHWTFGSRGGRGRDCITDNNGIFWGQRIDLVRF